MEEPVARIQVESVQELLEKLIHRSGTNGLYRGQADSRWGLETRLERTITTAVDNDPLGVERRIHRNFMDRASTYIPRVPDEHDELGWLALMQHYGAPTRLLDWTKSTLVALYFAYETEAPSDAPARALWALDAATCRNFFGTPMAFSVRDPFGLNRSMTYDQEGNLLSDSHPGASHDWLTTENETFQRLRDESTIMPYPVPPPLMDSRMAAQQAFFTYDATLKGGIPLNLSVPTPVFAEDGLKTVDRPLLQKVLLPHEWRVEVLGALRKMGITAAALFPGLDGLGRAARVSALLPGDLEDLIGY